MNQYEWVYKDANRTWWKLTLERGRPEEDEEFGGINYWWNYHLIKDYDLSEPEHAWSGEIFVWNGLWPTLDKVMKDIASQVAILTVGFAVHGVQTKGPQ